MNYLRVKTLAGSMLLAGISFLPALAWSMDAMSDGQMAQTTGQDGITLTLGLPSTGLSISQVAVFDGNGFTGYTGAGALVIGQNANAAGAAAGSNPTNGNAINILPGGSITATIDATGGGASGAKTGTSPMTNIAVSLPTSFTLTTGDIGVAAATGTAGNYLVTANTTSPNMGDVLIMNSATINVSFASTPLITIQLGNASQTVVNPSITSGSQNVPVMIKLSSFNISSLVFSTPLSLASPNTGGTASQLAVTPTITNLNLTGAGIGLLTQANMDSAQNFNNSSISGGVLFQDSSLTVGSAVFSNLTAGTSGNADTTFGGMKNAPLGTFGAANIVVSGLKVGVSGM